MGEQVRMTSVEYRKLMGLDETTSTKTKVVVKEKERDGLADGFILGMNRLVLRLIWLAGWAWMIFSFGWIGYAAIRITERQLNKS